MSHVSRWHNPLDIYPFNQPAGLELLYILVRAGPCTWLPSGWPVEITGKDSTSYRETRDVGHSRKIWEAAQG